MQNAVPNGRFSDTVTVFKLFTRHHIRKYTKPPTTDNLSFISQVFVFLQSLQ